MTICVFGASRDDPDPGFFRLGEALGEAMARRGHAMIFGGGAHGLMGAAARGCARGGGPVIGVAPRFFDMPGVLFEQSDEMVLTGTMSERKEIMTERSDAFLALPGGLGTLDEIFEVLTLRALGRDSRPIAFLDYDDYWLGAERMIETAVERGFAGTSVREIYGRFSDPEKCLDYLERGTVR